MSRKSRTHLEAVRLESIRKNSGEFRSKDPVVVLLYTLMRDHLPTSDVEKLIQDSQLNGEECLFTNGWLAKYAENLAQRLKEVPHIEEPVVELVTQ